MKICKEFGLQQRPKSSKRNGTRALSPPWQITQKDSEVSRRFAHVESLNVFAYVRCCASDSGIWLRAAHLSMLIGFISIKQSVARVGEREDGAPSQATTASQLKGENPGKGSQDASQQLQLLRKGCWMLRVRFTSQGAHDNHPEACPLL